MKTITEINDQYGNGHAIAGHAVGANGESILLVSLPPTSFLASSLKERLAVTAASLPFVLAASFASFVDSSEQAPSAEATGEPSGDATDGAETDGATVEGAETTEVDEDAPKTAIGYAVLVDDVVKTSFLLCQTLSTDLPVENLDDNPADHTPLIFGLTDEEIADPSEALKVALKLVNDNEEVVFLLPQAPKAKTEGEAEAEGETAPASGESEAVLEEGAQEGAESSSEEATGIDEDEEAAKAFLGKLGDEVYVDFTFDHNDVTYRVCAVAF